MEISSSESLFGSDPNRYWLVFQLAADPCYVADAAGTILDLNPAAERLLGVCGGPGGRSLPEMFTEPERREEFLRRIEQDGLVREARVSLETYGGTVIDVAVSASAVRVEGRLTGFFGSIRDVTLETQTCALLADMARFPADDPNPVMRINEEGVVTYANVASAPLLEAWSIQVGQGLPWEAIEETRRCAANGRSCQFELAVEGRVWLIFCSRVAGQSFLHLYGFDITARRQAELEAARQADELARANEQLRQANERLNEEAKRLELIVRGIGDGVIVTDLEHRVTIMNHAAIELLEVKGTNGTGNLLPALLGDCTPDPVRLKEALDACRPDRPEEIALELHAPCARTLRIMASAWLDPAGRVAGRVLILRDVTRELEIDRLKTDFVGSVSHELRTPLTSIKGFTKALRQDGSMGEVMRNQFLDIIDKETLRLEALIEDLLEISRLESGRFRLERHPVDMAGLIGATCETLKPMIEAACLNLRLDLAEPLPTPIGDRTALQRVLINIISNAVKFTPAGGSIAICAAGGDPLAITVADTGIGIPQTDLPHLFERFYRVHRPGTEIAGTGLGLAIVHEIVQRHGGTVAIESRLGQGTKVTVKLPIHSILNESRETEK